MLAKTAGVKINNGIVVNASLQTSDPNIFAIGECAEVDGQLTMHIAPIILCAHVLGKMLVGDVHAVKFPVMPIVIKTPACPIVVVTPPKNCGGEWRVGFVG
jgi:NAD(P)H-nitrite reductase